MTDRTEMFEMVCEDQVIPHPHISAGNWKNLKTPKSPNFSFLGYFICCEI